MRLGPLIHIGASCAACRYEVAGACTAPTVTGDRVLPPTLETPGFCPLRRQAIADAVELMSQEAR